MDLLWYVPKFGSLPIIFSTDFSSPPRLSSSYHPTYWKIPLITYWSKSRFVPILYHLHSYKEYTNLHFNSDMLIVTLFAQLDFENKHSFKILSQKIGTVPVSKQHRITSPPRCLWWTAQTQSLSRPVLKDFCFKYLIIQKRIEHDNM